MIKKILLLLIFMFIVTSKVFAGDYNLEAVRQYNLGLEQARVGAYSSAIDYFKSAIEIQPDFYDAYYNTAVVYEKLGDYSRAIVYLNAILKDNPEDSASLFKSAQIYYKKGETAKAKEFLANIGPTSAEYNKARSLEEQINLQAKAQSKYSGQSVVAPVVPVTKKIIGVNAPSGIAADTNGQIYAASFSDSVIFKLMPNGIHQLYAKNPLINGPIGMAFDRNGNLYVANYNNNNVLKIDKVGSVSVFVNYSDKPYAVYVKDNILYVTEQGTNTILTKKLY